MYFGSVKFFKHIITVLVIIAITLLSLFTISLSMQNRGLKKDLDLSKNEIADITKNYDEMMNKSKSDEKNINEQNLNLESEQTDKDATEIQPMPYHSKYKEMFVEKPKDYVDDKGCVYLTFDRSPSNNTLKILDTLDEFGVKATFFISKQDIENEDEILKEIISRGHAIGMNCYNYDFKKIYDTVDTFLDDIYKIYTYIYETTGVKPTVVRFPGGSINSYNAHNYREIIAEIIRRGFLYYDWNLSTVTSTQSVSSKNIYNRVVNTFNSTTERIILLSNDVDDSNSLIEALPDIISFFKEKQLKFSTLDNSVKPLTFGYKN